MPKLKTHKGTKGRMKVSARGKVLRRKSGSSHLMSVKSSKRKRMFRKDTGVSHALSKKIKTLIGA